MGKENRAPQKAHAQSQKYVLICLANEKLHSLLSKQGLCHGQLVTMQFDCNLTLCHAQVVLSRKASPLKLSVCHKMNEEFGLNLHGHAFLDKISSDKGFHWQALVFPHAPQNSHCLPDKSHFQPLSETRTFMKSKLGGRTKLINFRSPSRGLFYRLA